MKLAEHQFVFDLDDDTLYKEIMYVKSALKYVGRLRTFLHGGQIFCQS